MLGRHELPLVRLGGPTCSYPTPQHHAGGGLGVVALITLGNGLVCGIGPGLIVSKRNRGS